MSRNFKQALVALFLLGQLVAVWALAHTRDQNVLSPEESLKRYGFYLRDHTLQAGLDFKHASPRELDPDLKHILPLIASMGASVSVVDFDKDGLLDLYVVTSREGGQNKLFRNRGDGTFEDVATKVGLADLNRRGDGVCQGAVWGDFDNDGFEDLFVYRWGKPELYRNVEGKRFERVENAGLPDRVNANSAVWVDYDCDGHLDLFIAGYWGDDVNLWDLGGNTKIMPESFVFAKNGGRKYLLRNMGDGTFEDVTKKLGIQSTRWTLGVQAADLCGTGYPDIVLANDYGVSEFLCNKKGQRFEEIGNSTGIGEHPKSGMNVSFGDIYNKGKFSLYITNITEPGNLVQNNWLWVPNDHKPGEAPKYTDEASNLRVGEGGWSWGAQFGDLNNDGRQDLYLTNGYISADKKQSYWYDYGLIAGGNKVIINDAKNWPTIGNRSLSGYQKKRLWMNKGGSFIEIAVPVGISDVYDGRAVALADLGNRGILDVLVANQNGPLLYYKNTVAEGRDWVQFQLTGAMKKGERTEKKSNTSAIGALVRVFWTMRGSDRTQEQVQVVSGGNGYASQNMRRLHFGLGEDSKIEKVIIQWPSGGTQTLTDVKANILHKIIEEK